MNVYFCPFHVNIVIYSSLLVEMENTGFAKTLVTY